MDNKEPISTYDIYAKALNPTENIYIDLKSEIRHQGFAYLPAFKAALISMGIQYSIYRKIILSAKKSGDFDFIIVDTDSCFDEEKMNLIDISDKVIVVTDQSYSSVHATNNFVSNVNGISQDKYVFICNRFNTAEYNELVTPNGTLKFNISEYIANRTDLEANIFSKNRDIKKISFLVM